MCDTFTGSLRTALCAILLILGLGVTAAAQFRAGVQGSVTDAAGAVVPGATVTLTNNETSRTQQVTTSDEGFYSITGLAPGRYTITAEQAGFNKATIENFAVSAEETQGLDLALTTGPVSETVTVTADAATQGLETETANVRGVITTEEVRQLPQVGRNPYELARTAPGIRGDTARSSNGNAQFIPGGDQTGGGSNSGVFQTENQTQITANGQRVSSNNYLIDGVSVNSLGIGGAAVVTPNQESVKEVVVSSNTYSAEDGRNTGAQVKVVSQNGTNEFHGTAVINYTSPRFNSFNKFFGSSDAPRRPERVELLERKFAGSLGGPIYLPRFGEGGPTYFSGKNRSFFFFSYEGLRRSNTTFTDRFVETPEFRRYVQTIRPGGLAAQLFSTDGIAPRTVSTGLTPGGGGPGRAVNGQAGLSFDIGSLDRAINQTIDSVTFDGVPDITLARLAFPESSRGNQYNTRIDFNSGSNQFAVSTYFTKLNNFTASPNARAFEDRTFAPLNSAVTLAFIRAFSPSVLNEARFNFTRFSSNELSSSADANFGIPRIESRDFGPTLGVGENVINFGIGRFGTGSRFAQNTYEFRDVLTYVRGNQVFKFGGEVRREQDNNNIISTARPEFIFRNFLSFANDAVFFQSIDIDPTTGGAVNGQRYFRTNSYGLFVQNDWKVRPNLTLNLGLRYEYQTPFTEKEGRLSNYIFGSNGITDGRVQIVDRLYDPDRNNFAPRLGFAYSPTRFSQKLVVRGGFGVAYDRLFTNLFSSNRRNTPFVASASVCCAGVGDLNAPDGDRRIIYSFSLPGQPFAYPINPNFTRGIDPQTGGLLDANPSTLAGGFVRRDVPVEINGTLPETPNPYIYSYSLEVQYQFGARTVLSLGYQGSTGHKLIRTVDLNRFTPGDTFGTNNRDRVQVADARGNTVTPRLTGNPNFDRILFPLPDVNSNYNSAILRVTRQYARDFTLEGIYTFSKSIDTASFGRGPQQSDPSDQQLNRGPSDFDINHNLIISGLYDIPLFRSREGFVGKLLGGFQISGIFTARSGFPFSPVAFGDEATDLNGDGFRPDRPTGYFGGIITNPSNEDFINGIFPGSSGRITNPDGSTQAGGTRYFDITTRGPAGVGRNAFRGPGFRSLDLSLIKQTGLPKFLGLGERANLDLRANLFNVLNLLNLPSFDPASDRTDVGNPNFGRATSGLAGRVVEFQARFSF